MKLNNIVQSEVFCNEYKDIYFFHILERYTWDSLWYKKILGEGILFFINLWSFYNNFCIKYFNSKKEYRPYCRYHHVATCINGFVYESLEKFSADSLEDWLTKKTRDVAVLKPKDPIIYDVIGTKKVANQMIGQPYDYFGTFLFQLIFQITGIWLGEKNTTIKSKKYCSEASAFLESVANPKTKFKDLYKTSPMDFLINTDFYCIK